MKNKFKIFSCLMGLFLFTIQIFAQPSGGPYGPIMQTYKLPTANTIYYVAPDGDSKSVGTELNNPTTLETAITKVVTGDAIILRGGVYRIGELEFNQGITIQPYKDEQPILKGTKVVTEGKALKGGIWKIPWKTFFPSKPLNWWWRDREGVKTPLHRFNNDIVFVDGKFLQSAGWEGEVDSNSYYIDYKNEQVYIAVDPAKHLVEITAYNCAFLRTSAEVHGKQSDKIGPTIKGITITQYAWRGIEIEGKQKFGPTDEPTDEPFGLSDPTTYGKEVIGTTLENVTITNCSRVAGFFRGDSLTIRNSYFSNTSTEGVYIIGSSDCLLEGNIFGRNNIENLTGYFPSAVKIFNQSHRVICRNNLVIDNPNSNGIWYDVGNKDGIFVNNWVQDCENGFFFEISKGALCAGNVFINCAYGIYVLNSSDVHTWNNTMINSPVTFKRDNRQAGGHFGWHAATGPDVDERDGHLFVNNLLAVDKNYARPFLEVIQSEDLCGKLESPQLNKLDGNVYANNSIERPLYLMSPTKSDNCLTEFSIVKELQKLNSEYEVHGHQINSKLRSIFKSPELKNYELISPIQDPAKVISIPAEVKKLLDWEDFEITTPGAYPIIK